MSAEKGFSLIEILVAMALITGGMLAIAQMTLTAYGGVDRNGERTTAIVLCQERVEWLRNQPYTSAPLNAGTASEILAGEFAGYTRTTQISDNTPRAGVKHVTVTTTTPNGRSVELVSLFGE